MAKNPDLPDGQEENDIPRSGEAHFELSFKEGLSPTPEDLFTARAMTYAALGVNHMKGISIDTKGNKIVIKGPESTIKKLGEVFAKQVKEPDALFQLRMNAYALFHPVNDTELADEPDKK